MLGICATHNNYGLIWETRDCTWGIPEAGALHVANHTLAHLLK